MSNFAFLQPEWPLFFEAAAKAEGLADLDALFASLQQRAFRGEL
jgi:type I restriction enzyme, R subunit